MPSASTTGTAPSRTRRRPSWPAATERTRSPEVRGRRRCSAAAVRQLNIDLAAALGSSAGDGQADRVTVVGTEGNDRIDVSDDAGAVKVSGLAAAIRILHPEAALDRVDINTLGGVDSVASAALSAGAIQLFVDGLIVH